MKVLVVGSEGYVGRALCDNLLQLGVEVVGTDCLVYGQKPRPYCITDRLVESVALDTKPDCVVWLAAYAHDPSGRIPRTAMMQNNSLRPIEFCHRILDTYAGRPPFRLVVTSSLSVHAAGRDSYPDSKRDLERRLAELNPHRWIRVFRFGTLFGHHEPESFRPHLLLNRMTLDAVRKGRIQVQGPDRRRPVLPLVAAVRLIVNSVLDNGPDGVVANRYFRSRTLLQYAQDVQAQVTAYGLPAEIVVGGPTGDTRDYGFSDPQSHWGVHLVSLVKAVRDNPALGAHDPMPALYDFVARSHPHAAH